MSGFPAAWLPRRKDVWRRERDELCNAFDVGNESSIEHAVRFVDDEDIDTRQQQLAALEVVEKTPRCGDKDIRAALQLAVLVLE